MCYNILMETITIRARDNATLRTKNRVREAEGRFVVRMGPGHEVGSRLDSVLLQSADGEWFGWLPLKEIEIKSCD